MDWYFKKKSIILKSTSSKDAVRIIFLPKNWKRKEDTLLDAKDLSAIAEIVEKAVQKSEARMVGLIQESEARMTGLIQESIQASEARMTKLIQTSIQASEDRMTRRMKKMLFKSESMLLD